jgi:nitrilase
MRRTDFPAGTPYVDLILANCEEWLANGGSCISGPDGEWLVEPVIGEERLIVATLDHQRVRAERQNFDPAGHYARPDVTQLVMNRKRQSTLAVVD